MKKILLSLVLAMAMFAVAKPAMAAPAGCHEVKIERRGFAYTKMVCVNPTQPVNVSTVATSFNGRAVAKSVVIVRSSGSVNVSVSSIAIANSN